jgi:hypothetical protein
MGSIPIVAFENKRFTEKFAVNRFCVIISRRLPRLGSEKPLLGGASQAGGINPIAGRAVTMMGAIP